MSKNENMEQIADTSLIQEESLVRYMAALGYDPVYDQKSGVLVRFYEPNYAKNGNAYVSLASAIERHNRGPQRALAKVRLFSNPDFNDVAAKRFDDLIRKESFLEAVVDLFAGQAKIVRRVKAQGSKNRGLIFNEDAHKIEFSTKYDKRQFIRFVEDKNGGEVVRTIKNFG